MSGTACVDQSLDCATTADSGNYAPTGRKRRGAIVSSLKMRHRREIGTDGADSTNLILKNKCPTNEELEKVDESISVCKELKSNATDTTEPEETENTNFGNFVDGISDFLNLPGSGSQPFYASFFVIFSASLIRLL